MILLQHTLGTLYRRNPALILLGLFLLSGGILAFIGYQISPVTETKNSEMSNLPRDVRPTIMRANPASTVRVPILIYHYVEVVKEKRDTIRQSLDILPAIFDRQVKTLFDAGYTFLTASDLADILDGKKELPSKPILLTFDDGHWDLYTDVLPILEKYQVKATAYIVTGFIGGSDYLSSGQLQKVIDSGLVEIGAHTVHHLSLAKKIAPIVQYEVTHSKEDLEKTYHLKVVSFAYPNGSFDKQSIMIVSQAGFRTAVSTVPGIAQSQANRYFLYRLRPGGRTGDQLIRYLDQTTFRPW